MNDEGVGRAVLEEEPPTTSDHTRDRPKEPHYAPTVQLGDSAEQIARFIQLACVQCSCSYGR
jgi:hypothetical protein